jgi:hypothetical protein
MSVSGHASPDSKKCGDFDAMLAAARLRREPGARAPDHAGLAGVQNPEAIAHVIECVPGGTARIARAISFRIAR